LLARAIQHEIDHLDGILFTDRLTSLDTLRKVEPEEQEKEAELVGA
jgi:peptide deformylase